MVGGDECKALLESDQGDKEPERAACEQVLYNNLSCPGLWVWRVQNPCDFLSGNIFVIHEPLGLLLSLG